MADAAERMAGAERLDELWTQVAQEAAALVEADGTAVLELRNGTWRPLAVQARDGAADDEFLAGVERIARQRLLLDAGRSHDLEDGASAPGWRSVLVAEVDLRPSPVPTRLLWRADRPGAFAAYAELAVLLARHAGVAARAVGSREHLTRAVEARHRIGQAQGILMARHKITAEQAFDVLKFRSQHTNTKLRTLADYVIMTGGLPVERRAG